MKEYGQTVTLVRNGVELNALVAASSIQPDGEHLTVAFLDPAFAGQMLGGAGLQRAIQTAFVSPLKEGTVNGWKDEEKPTLHVRPDATLAGVSGAPVEVKVVEPAAVPYKAPLETSSDPAVLAVYAEQITALAQQQSSVTPQTFGRGGGMSIDGSSYFPTKEQKIAAGTAGPDGTSPSDSAPAQASVAAKEELALGEEPAPPKE